MYTLRILTQNEECNAYLTKSFIFDNVSEDFFELIFNNEKTADEFKRFFESILENFDDTDVYVYEQTEEIGESFTDYESGKRFY